MTSETRIMVDLADISSIEIECRECGAKIAYPREKNQERIAQQCPNCNANLFTLSHDSAGRNGSVSLEQVRLLMRVVRFLSNPGADCHANIRIHVNMKSATQTQEAK